MMSFRCVKIIEEKKDHNALRGNKMAKLKNHEKLWNWRTNTILNNEISSKDGKEIKNIN